MGPHRYRRVALLPWAFGLACILTCAWSSRVHAAEEKKPEPAAATQKTSDIGPENNPKDPYRNFYQVLEDVLADFEFDLKNGNVDGLKHLAIRNIATSENIPESFKTHLELLTSERILKHTHTRLVQCLPCRAKRAVLEGNSVVITSPDSDPDQLTRIARNAGIKHFMDLAFAYQPSGLILSMYITTAEDGSVVWSRSYNSETSRASAFRRGVDFDQLEQARTATTYTPTLAYRPTLYFMYERTTTAYITTIVPAFRLVERYANRTKEVGFELNYILPITTIAGAKADPTNIYGGFNLTMLFVHSWNIIGELENFNRVRGNIFVAAGGTYASGFIGALVRGGYEWRLAKYWAVHATLGFRPAGSVFIGGTEAGSVAGAEFGVGVSALF